jgi:septal ring factor EnvC (AmiA/AmiB activator)
VKWLAVVTLIAASATAPAHMQDRSRTEGDARRVDERIRALEREADQLAGQARTLLGDLRRLEIERDLQVERVKEAEAVVAAAQDAARQIAQRLQGLEQQRIAQLPDLKTQLVDVYKRGRAGYARLLFGASGVKELGRATRAVAALVRINEQRVEEHRRTLEAMRTERAALDDKVRELQSREAETRQARAAAERAIAARSALIAQIDARRDLNAQLAGELQVAYTRLQQ